MGYRFDEYLQAMGIVRWEQRDLPTDAFADEQMVSLSDQSAIEQNPLSTVAKAKDSTPLSSVVVVRSSRMMLLEWLEEESTPLPPIQQLGQKLMIALGCRPQELRMATDTHEYSLSWLQQQIESLGPEYLLLTGSGWQSASIPTSTPSVQLPALQAMLADPQLKKTCWKALAPVRQWLEDGL